MNSTTLPASRRPSGARLATRALIAMLLMLTLEGAVRKWISSGLTVPVIGLRDLLALFAVGYAFFGGYVSPRKNGISLLFSAWVYALIAWGLFQVSFGYSNLFTLAIGLRFWCLYIAFGLCVGQMMDRVGFAQFIRLALWLMIFMAPLAVLQFLSPGADFINRQVDGDPDTVFTVAMGIVRTTGTFSFTVGYTTLLALLTPVVVASYMEYRRLGISLTLARAGFIATAVCTAVCGSRAGWGFFALTIFFGALFSLLFHNWLMKRKAILLLAGTLIFGTVTVYTLPDTLASMQVRVQTASLDEDLGQRIGSILMGDQTSYDVLTWHGMGLGAASGMATYIGGGQREFVGGEVENGRLLAEGGIFGGIYLLLKLCLVVAGSVRAFGLSVRTRSILIPLTWFGFVVAFVTWQASGQITENAAFGVYVALACIVLRNPDTV